MTRTDPQGDPPSSESLRGPMAFVWDVRANLVALDAALKACRAAGAENVFVLGDTFLHGDDPMGVWTRLVEIKARCIRGAGETALATVDPSTLKPRDPDARAAAERFALTRKKLGDLVVARLGRLPERIRITLGNGERVLAVYGSPRDPLEHITHDQTDEEVESLLGDAKADVVVCAGNLVPFEREVGRVHVVGLGSLGAARDADGGVAHYTLIEPVDDTVSVHQAFARWPAA